MQSRQFAVLNEVLKLSEGRDKLGKMIQYSARLVSLFLVTRVVPSRTGVAAAYWKDRSRILMDFSNRLSVARKLARFLIWLPDCSELFDSFREYDRSWQGTVDLVNACMNVGTDMCDDVDALSSFELLPGPVGDWAALRGAQLWFGTVVVELVYAVNALLRVRRKLAAAVDEARRPMTTQTAVRLLADEHRAAAASAAVAPAADSASAGSARAGSGGGSSASGSSDDADADSECVEQKRTVVSASSPLLSPQQELQRQVAALRGKRHECWLNVMRYLCDLVFSATEAFELSTPKPVKVSVALVSAFVSFRKVWRRMSAQHGKA